MLFAKKSVLLAASALGAVYSVPALAQDTKTDSADSGFNNDIVVTARRVEEKLQDVPISITVLSAEKISNNNVSSAKDIATYTPGLTTNNRFGSDNTTWTIRGFTQEQRTSATVGTFFNDVVAPRGSGATQGGDGAGPGLLFDLANVQVLKGPQGTLQGRNTTGGSVLLVPKKPSDKFEGYVEGSTGNYGMWRVQGVLNVPVNDTIRVRLGVDRQKRDGYLKNVGKIGFGPFGDAGNSTDYTALRLGVLMELTPDIENYTLVNWSHSKSTGVVPKITKAFYRDPYSLLTGTATQINAGTPGAYTPVDIGQTVTGTLTTFGQIAQNQIDYENANCSGNPWCISNAQWDAGSESRTWQASNTTTWKASDSLTVKGILSYGEFRGDTTEDLFGIYNPFFPPGNINASDRRNAGLANLNAVAGPLWVRNFASTRAPYGLHTNAESSWVAELQFQGHGERFNWQGGVYFENSDPLGKSGTVSPSQTPCAPAGTTAFPAAGAAVPIATDPSQVCIATPNQGTSLGRVGFSLTSNYFRDKAVYWQGIFKLTDQIKFTAGARYTWDTMRSDFQLENLRYYTATITSGFNGLNAVIPGTNTLLPGLNQGVGFCVNSTFFGFPPTTVNPAGDPGNQYFPAADAANRCQQSHTVKSSAPTWLLGLDYKPTDNILLYAKYSRGYRQGGVASFALDQMQDYKKEKVDTYEVGAKTSWRGAMPGYFNISAYYNNFRDQQLQIGSQCLPTTNCAQTTIIANAGKSKLKGFEIETGISPFTGFKLEASYAYLTTRIDQIADITAQVLAANPSLATANLDLRGLPIGAPILNAQPHKLVLNASYTLPIDSNYGKITFGATMVYSSKYRTVSDPAVLASCTTNPVSGAAQSVNTDPNRFVCGKATPLTFAPGEYGVLPGSKVFNLNVNWENVGGSPVDASFFVTNLTNEVTYVHTNVQSQVGFISSILGEPKMYGFRLRYRFGS